MLRSAPAPAETAIPKSAGVRELHPSSCPRPVLSVCAVLLCFFCASISDSLEKGRSFLLIRRRHHELPGLAEPSSRIEGWLTTTVGHLSQGLVRIAGSRDLTDLVAVFPCFAESETSFFLYPARWYAY